MIMASSLVVLKFDSPEGADKGLEVAQRLQKQAWAFPDRHLSILTPGE
jgi:hypothetical protein